MLWLHLDPIPVVVAAEYFHLVAPGPVDPRKDTEEGASKEEDVWTRCVTTSIHMVSN